MKSTIWRIFFKEIIQFNVIINSAGMHLLEPCILIKVFCFGVTGKFGTGITSHFFETTQKNVGRLKLESGVQLDYTPLIWRHGELKEIFEWNVKIETFNSLNFQSVSYFEFSVFPFSAYSNKHCDCFKQNTSLCGSLIEPVRFLTHALGWINLYGIVGVSSWVS